MAIKPDKIDRLKSQLLTSGLSQKNNPLFQVINSLIDAIKELITTSNSSSGGGGGPVTNITNIENTFLNPLNNLLYGNGDMPRYYIPSDSSSSIVSGDDYVVLSDGSIPLAQPVNDGAGNFIYIPYIP